MGYYITPQGRYYENEREHALDVEVPQRPSLFHHWDGASWVLDQSAQHAEDAAAARAAIDAAEAAQAKADAQLIADLNLTPAEVNVAVDQLFSTWTAPQRAFLKRLTRMVLAAARRVLR